MSRKIFHGVADGIQPMIEREYIRDRNGRWVQYSDDDRARTELRGELAAGNDPFDLLLLDRVRHYRRAMIAIIALVLVSLAGFFGCTSTTGPDCDCQGLREVYWQEYQRLDSLHRAGEITAYQATAMLDVWVIKLDDYECANRCL